MKLSLAIRLGAMLRPQVYELFARGGSCAMGAALEAYGVPYAEGSHLALIERLIEISKPIERIKTCPACTTSHLSCGRGAVEHLNDYHRWTRERIADWVATIEPQEAGCAEEVRLGQEVGA